jgi:cob(I)alamin adenosyltransferase
MKIYTKTGDQGETGLFGNVRVRKDDLRIRTYGTLDELNASLGVALAEFAPDFRLKAYTLAEMILRVQGELFQLGAELATPHGKKVPTQLLATSHIERLEQEIDEMEAALAPLKNFILPGGARVSALLHHSRTISRRVERELVSLNHSEPVRAETLAYINRLSDHLFVLARFMNAKSGQADVAWTSPSNKPENH